ncbi:MAG: T9SS C-terminal target domain-containing protein [Calditrichaeota bacterium]|nr:MAG: T9SS C-terminal target domain-containing protein [Calditrichota bacterium]
MKYSLPFFVMFSLACLLVNPSNSYSQSASSILSFEMISNGNGLINDVIGFDMTTAPTDYGAYSADWYRDVLLGSGSVLGLPNGMQASGGWYFIVAGSAAIQDYESALNRWTRNGSRDDILDGNTYEIRFTENGAKAQMAFTTQTLVDVPFEIWRIAVLPTETNRDIRMIPWIYDDNGDDTFNFKLDHQAADGDDDPYSDWIYFVLPDDDSPGQSGYDQFVQDVMNGTYNFGGQEHLARLILMNWNQHQGESFPGAGDGPINIMPEKGTIFRISFEPRNARNIVIDIKPGSDPNSINCDNDKGIIPVAILTTDDFNATEVYPPSVTFGPNKAQDMHGNGQLEDVDDDGDLDMLFHFRLAETGIQANNDYPILEGQSIYGRYFFGSDAIRCVPMLADCEKKLDDPGVHDRNNVRLLVGSDGRIAQNDSIAAHAYFPKNTCDQYIYSAGPSIGGKINGTPIVAHAPFRSEFVPSEIGDSGEIFRVFNSTLPKEKKIWPPEFSQLDGTPIIVGQAENLVVQYNDLYGPQRGDQPIPLGVEIRQRSLAFNDIGIDNALIFIWEITNISGQFIEDAAFGFWCDADVGNLTSASDDRTSVVNDIAITWDHDFSVGNFKEKPSIVGFHFLETPGNLGVANYAAFVNGGPNQESREDSAQYNFLTGANQFETDLTRDIRMLLSTGTFDLSDGESVVVAGALIFGQVPEGTTFLATDPDYPFRPDPSDPILADLLNTQSLVHQFYDQNLQGTGLPKRTAAEKTTSPDLVPNQFALHQNYPNPFNPETEIRFELPEASHVVLKIFNPLGQEIRTLVSKSYPAGYHSVRWDGKDNSGNIPASGVYIYQIKAGEFVAVKKMTPLR